LERRKISETSGNSSGKFFSDFADVKQTNYLDAVGKIKRIIATVFQQFKELFQTELLSEQQKAQFKNVTPDMDDVTAQSALQDLSCYLSLYYGKKGDYSSG